MGWRDLKVWEKGARYVVSVIVLGIISGIVAGIVVIPIIQDYREPTKELEITVARIHTVDGFSNPDYNKVLLFQGCGYRNLVIVHNAEIPEDLKSEDNTLMYSSKRGCTDCTYYRILILNRGEDIDDPLLFHVDMKDNLIIDEVDSKIEINKQEKSVPLKNNFLFRVIGGIKGNRSEELVIYGHTNTFVDLNVSCEGIKKHKCYSVKYDVGDIRDQNLIDSFFSINKIEQPEHNKDEMETYILSGPLGYPQFEKYPTDQKMTYLYLEEGHCKSSITPEGPTL